MCTYSVRRAAAGAAEFRNSELPEVNAIGGWSEAPGSQRVSQRKSAMRYAGDRDASAETSLITHIRVINAVARAVLPDLLSWACFRLKVMDVNQDKIRKVVMRDLLSETCEASSPE